MDGHIIGAIPCTDDNQAIGHAPFKELNFSRRNRPDLEDRSDAMLGLTQELHAEYCRVRLERGERGINKSDGNRYFVHLNNILTDLYAAWQGHPERYVGYSRGKGNYTRRGSYWDHKTDKSMLSQTIYLNLINHLSKQGYIENHNIPPGGSSISSRMRATGKLVD